MGLDEEKQRKSCVVGDGSFIAGMRPSKKNKHKKIPQRGLGVAQLEKLRMEEQQKNTASSSSDPSSQPFGLSQQQPYVPFTSNESIIKPRVASTLLLRPSVSVSSTTVDFLSSHAQPPQALETASGEQGFLPMLWNAIDPGACDTEALTKRFGFHVPLRTDLLNPNCRPVSLVQRKQQSAIALVNTATSPLSSGVNLRMEPPSNQNNSNSYDLLSCWREQERMVGMKRPWPFHLDGISSQTSSYPGKLPSFSSSRLKTEESSSVYENGLVRPESQSTGFRVGTSSSFVDLTCTDLRLDKSNKENGGITSDGNFLTLSSLSTPTSKSIDNLPFYQPSHSDFSLWLSQRSSVNGSSSHGKPFYSFLPMGPSSSETPSNERRGEAADGIDLNLKL